MPYQNLDVVPEEFSVGVIVGSYGWSAEKHLFQLSHLQTNRNL
jgi:hypothetical protein